jgi:membrane-associated tyrosine/threonine-specific cdc2-inhibitory kinase
LFDQNLFDATEGDSKYLAPEVLGGIFSKKADIFSLGITLLELACDLDLPANGTLWHELRHGSLPPTITRR